MHRVLMPMPIQVPCIPLRIEPTAAKYENMLIPLQDAKSVETVTEGKPANNLGEQK